VSLKYHGRWPRAHQQMPVAARVRPYRANARCSRLALATNTHWVPFLPKASSPHGADGRPAQIADVTLTRRAAGRLKLATI
jgi:hypothetical protein